MVKPLKALFANAMCMFNLMFWTHKTKPAVAGLGLDNGVRVFINVSCAVNQERQNTLHLYIVQGVTFDRFTIGSNERATANDAKLNYPAERNEHVIALLWSPGNIDNGITCARLQYAAVCINLAKSVDCKCLLCIVFCR